MKKIFLVGILLLNACIPITAVQPTIASTTSPTSTPMLEMIFGGWSTFHNSDSGFSFQYPAVYDKGFYDPVEPMRFCTIRTELKDNKFNIGLGGFIQITVQETNKNLRDYINEEITHYSTDGWQISSNQIIADNNIPGIRLDLIDNNMTRRWVRNYFIHNNYAIDIQYYEGSFLGCDPKGTHYSLYWIYEQIITTIRFDK